VDRRTGEAAYAHRAVVTEDATEDVIRSVRGVRRAASRARAGGRRPTASSIKKHRASSASYSSGGIVTMRRPRARSKKRHVAMRK
jgi:hypothetical protein